MTNETLEKTTLHATKLVDLFLSKLTKVTGLAGGTLTQPSKTLTVALHGQGVRPETDLFTYEQPMNARVMADALASLWLIALFQEGPDARLDEHLIPVSIKSLVKKFFHGDQLVAANIPVAWQEFLNVLTEIRYSLPEGQTLPEDAKALLDLCPTHLVFEEAP